jgi:transposase
LLALGSGRLEALLARHWPQATRLLPLTAGTWLRALVHYGGPAALAADAQAAEHLAGWGGRGRSAAKVQGLRAAARGRLGVRRGEIATRRLPEYASQALAARQQRRSRQRHLRQWVRGHAVLPTQAQVVGCATACVLWASVGDPRDYPCGQAYRKAMGLNLTEQSSGTHQGKLRLRQRGNPRPRPGLYFAAWRLVQQAGVRSWYQAKKDRDSQEAKHARVGVMRKLVLALYRVGVAGAALAAGRLFPGAAEASQA